MKRSSCSLLLLLPPPMCLNIQTNCKTWTPVPSKTVISHERGIKNHYSQRSPKSDGKVTKKSSQTIANLSKTLPTKTRRKNNFKKFGNAAPGLPQWSPKCWGGGDAKRGPRSKQLTLARQSSQRPKATGNRGECLEAPGSAAKCRAVTRRMPTTVRSLGIRVVCRATL